jgi:hypothetical protein
MATLQQKELLQIKVMLGKYKKYNEELAGMATDGHPTKVELVGKAKDRIGILEDILDALGGDLTGLKRLTTGLEYHHD